MYRKFKKVVLGLLAHLTPSIFFSRILRSVALVYSSFFFLRTAVLRKLFDIRFSYKHCNFPPPPPPPPPSIITVYRYLKTVVRCFFQKQAKSVIVTTSSKSSSKSDFKSNAVLYLETIFFSSLFILVT